ncbi:hypothetical protein ACH5RR_001554 [Cinchona calisaya]|uniref:Uncharacterized protein n=1 Tax=Cinchona calisaya TaxID=153742 RepID=A0ABD3B4I4_9GENT
MSPLIRLLRVCDTNEKPSMAYVYEDMQKVIEGIRKFFKNKDRLCKPYIDSINTWWDKMLHKSLCSAFYFFNPAFLFDPTYVGIGEIANGLLDYIETHVDWCEQSKFIQEIAMFRDRDKSFGRNLDLTTSRTNRLEFWVLEEEPNTKLDYDELEAKLEELPVNDAVDCSNSQKAGGLN